MLVCVCLCVCVRAPHRSREESSRGVWLPSLSSRPQSSTDSHILERSALLWLRWLRAWNIYDTNQLPLSLFPSIFFLQCVSLSFAFLLFFFFIFSRHESFTVCLLFSFFVHTQTHPHTRPHPGVFPSLQRMLH